MRILKGVLLVLILFLFWTCEREEKKSSPLNSSTKAKIHRTPMVTTRLKRDKKTPRIIPPEMPPVRIDPDPPGPRQILYYGVEPPVVCPTVDPVVIKADTIYDFPAIFPDFPGGQEALKNYLQLNLFYPEDAKELGIQGKVFVSFVVFEDGSIQQATILRGINGNKSCEKEVLRLIKCMPNWIPGKNNFGRMLKARVKMPVVFSLD